LDLPDIPKARISLGPKIEDWQLVLIRSS
jgi:hypothetical protein